jgi:S-adenosylmethionine hydrolase
MAPIALMTDFGLKDGNVGVMKGVILKIAPQARIIDISHQIGAQNILEAAFILNRSAPYFPDGTIHIAVVDPGVGTDRRPIAARLASQYFVGPDNGLVTLWLENSEKQNFSVEFFHLNQSQYWLKEVSHVFHGRDIFSPVAAHLFNGVPLEAMGAPITNPLRLALPRPKRFPNGWHCEVVYIDSFGNIASNLEIQQLEGQRIVTTLVNGVKIPGIASTFGDRPVGELVVLTSSTGNLIVSEVNGNAAQRLDCKIGDLIEVIVE